MKYNLKPEYSKLPNIVVSIEGVAYNLKETELKVTRPATANTVASETTVLPITSAQIEAIMKAPKGSPLTKLQRFYATEEESTALGSFHSLGKANTKKSTTAIV
jgi:hypothetical protein